MHNHTLNREMKMTTFFSPQDFSSVHSGTADAVQSLANTVLEAGYKITLLNLEVTRNALNQGAASVFANAGEEAQKMANYQPIAKEISTYFKNLTHISAETQVEIARQVQSLLSDLGKSAALLLDRASKSDANLSTAMAAAALKSALATATASCQSLTETAKRVSEMAEANANALVDSVHSIGGQQAPENYKKAA